MSTRRVRRVALNTAGIAVFVVSAFPVFWMISTAFKPNQEIFSSTPHPVPLHPTLHHFDYVLNGGIAGVSFWHYFVNSLVLAVGTVIVSGLLALMAATAVARFRFRFRTTFLILLLVVQMVPAEALVIPMFIDLKHLDLLNSLVGLTAVYVGFALPFGIWMLRGFVAAVPKELEDAAAIDGAGPIRIFFGRSGNDWGPIMAASTLLTLPVIAFFLLVQRRMVSGLVAGAVKG